MISPLSLIVTRWATNTIERIRGRVYELPLWLRRWIFLAVAVAIIGTVMWLMLSAFAAIARGLITLYRG